MLKSGLIGLLGLACLAGCSSTTSHQPGSDPAQGGTNGAGDAGAGTAGGTDTAGGAHAAGGDGKSGGAGTTGGAATGTGAPTTPAGFCAGYYAVASDLYAKCWGIPTSDVESLLSDPALCSGFIASVDQHRVGFDGSHGAACLSELKSAIVCDGVAEGASVSDCTLLLTPLVAPGGACSVLSDVSLGRECVDDAFCQPPSSYACSGVCAARAPVGAPCDSGSTTIRCVIGASCDSATQKCVLTPPPAALGETCGGTANGKCQNGLWCDRGTSGAASTGVCSAKKASGTCTQSEECQTMKVCAGAAGAKSCVAPKPSGADCTPGNQECSLLGHCGSDHKCSNVGVALGEPCGVQEGEAVPCVRGAYCEGGLLGPGVCRTPKATGAACTGTSLGECGGERGHCDATTNTCAACPS